MSAASPFYTYIHLSEMQATMNSLKLERIIHSLAKFVL